jgi:hypothetical protein
MSDTATQYPHGSEDKAPKIDQSGYRVGAFRVQPGDGLTGSLDPEDRPRGTNGRLRPDGSRIACSRRMVSASHRR